MKMTHRFHDTVLIVDINDGESGLFGMEPEKIVDEIVGLKKENSSRIAFDMSKKSYLNSSGLGEIIFVKDNLIDKGIELVLIHVSERIKSLLTMVGVDKFITIADSENDL